MEACDGRKPWKAEATAAAGWVAAAEIQAHLGLEVESWKPSVAASAVGREVAAAEPGAVAGQDVVAARGAAAAGSRFQEATVEGAIAAAAVLGQEAARRVAVVAEG
jgi:hypothetical protein